jgi:WD40 repeat protein
VSPDGKTLASAGNDGKLKLWNLTALLEVATMPGRIPPATMKLEFTSNGKTLVAFSYDRLVRVWHAPSFPEIEAAERARPDGK